MKILVTGDAGFIASKLKIELEKTGHSVFGYDIVRGDNLLDLHKLEKAIENVDVVYHIAAQADLTKMAEDLNACREGVLNNVEATHNVSYACAKYNKWLIFASTVCVYGNVDEHPANEDRTLPNPSEIYACSKYSAEWIIRGYGLSHNLSWTILRFATIYGPGMRDALGLYIFFKQALLNKSITVHGDGSQDRTLTFIDDLVEGIITPLKYPSTAKNNIFNITSKTAVSALKMAQDVTSITGKDSSIEHITQRKNQTLHEDIDTTKASEILHWKASTSWEDGLKETYKWMLAQMNNSTTLT